MRQYQRLTKKIEIAEAELEAVREARSSISVQMDGMPRGSGLADKTATLAAKLIDMESELVDLRAEAWEARRRVVATINKVPSAEQSKVLYLRYIEGMTWDGIVEAMAYSYKWVFILHGRALQEVEKIMGA